jgi:RNA polymerase-interacting CarD/CdnL/TRCF family regulator
VILKHSGAVIRKFWRWKKFTRLKNGSKRFLSKIWKLFDEEVRSAWYLFLNEISYWPNWGNVYAADKMMD